MEDSALGYDYDFICTHMIAPTQPQNHHKYHSPPSSDVRVASKIQAKNKRCALTGNENVMLCLGTTEASSSEDRWEGRGAKSVFLKTHVQKVILHTIVEFLE